MIAVMGGTGRTGGATALRLLKAGEHVPMMATRDVGAATAAALRSRDWTGLTVRDLLGPRDLTYAEVTRLIGAAIGRPDLTYVQIPEHDLRVVLEAAGWSPDGTRLQLEMNRAFSDGSVAAGATRTAESTTRTRFEDFAAEELAPAFAALTPAVQ